LQAAPLIGLISPAAPGWLNMATDQALLDLADTEGRATLRLYGWEPSCLSFGRNESARRRYDAARIAALGLDLVRRPTGGRAVWHAEEITYALAAPVERYGTLTSAYRAIHAMLIAALRRLGVAGTLAPSRAPSLHQGACFATAVGGEILVQGRKLVGSAQLQQGRAFLQHGSILLDGSQNPVREVTRTESPLISGGETTLREALGRPLPREVVVQAIVDEAQARPGEVAGLMSRIRFHTEQFRSPDWIWRR
jgi:lipoyl(octanoyl) transferase